MKIGIVTELTKESVNYGNVLQAYALNQYLNKNKQYKTETLLVNGIIYKKITSYNPIIFLNKVKRVLKSKFEKKYDDFDFASRRNNFKKFINKINVCEVNNISEIENLNYDCVIVGSDIVWVQDRGVVNRLKFLDFSLNKKISYAASFGGDYIPKENRKFIKKYLSDFSFVSVREKSTVDLLNKIGVDNVKHVCDPTLLLTRNDWESIEKSVKIEGKYIFVYLLGKDDKQRNIIKKVALENNLKIVSVPHANGHYDQVDDDFADINISDCSPENWIYLIHNAEFVFTDSFHGTVFSSIFEKKFIVVKRKNNVKINNRMLDYINNIGESDKFVYLNEAFSLKKMNWNYKVINKKLSKLILRSAELLRDNITK